MKESRWDDCLEEGSAIKVSKDLEKSKSLAKIAEGRIAFLEQQKIKEDNANYVFEGLYTSATELIHALVAREGYKILNHICLGYFLCDKIGSEELFRIFDDVRYKRNRLVYYGKEMDFETASEAIEKTKNLIRQIQKILSR